MDRAVRPAIDHSLAVDANGADGIASDTAASRLLID